jgi:hypothetical protein
VYPEFPHFRRFLFYRIGLLRSLHRWLISWGVGYVAFKGSEEDFWKAASNHVPYFSSPLSVDELDESLGNWSQWVDLRAQVQPKDRIFPFAINVDTKAMRLGYVVIRQGKPIGGVVKVAS